jgi:regulator of protease activity HflC (stomatin/prohibitin superfamily)
MVWIAKWVPRLVLVTSRHRAVVFRPKDRVTEHAPGLLVYWPIIHVCQLVSMQLRTMELATQVHGDEAVQIVISYRILEPKVALLSLNDPIATIDDWSAKSLAVV